MTREQRLEEALRECERLTTVYSAGPELVKSGEVAGNFDVLRVRLRAALAASGSEPPAHPAQLALEHDRTQVAECVTAIKKELHAYSWLIEGRGSYEWDDDRWHNEFKTAVEAIDKSVAVLAEIAADWSNCSRKDADVKKARSAAPPSVTELRARLDEHQRSCLYCNQVVAGCDRGRELQSALSAAETP